MTKQCSRCKKYLDLDKFCNASKGLHKKQAYCKICNLNAQLEWKSNNREHVNEKARIFSKKLSYRYKTAIRAATRRGYKFLLTFEQFKALVEKNNCYYCDGKLAKLSGGGLDRLDGLKDYSIDNVVPCCVVCNKIRNVYLTPEETKAVIELVLSMRGGFAKKST